MSKTSSHLTTSQLVRALAAAHPARLHGAIEEALLNGTGLSAVDVWVSDMSYSKLRRMVGAETVEIDGSLVGRCFTTKEVVETDERILVPIESVGRTLGVLELTGELSADLQGDLLVWGTVIAERMLSAKGQSDEIEKLRGAGALGVPATIQHELLPIPSYADSDVELGGQIEPAYEIAGDAFDYAINDGHIDFGVFDAVGHGLRSSMLTTLTVASLRLARRRSEPVETIGESIERTLAGVTEVGEFVTGVVGRISVADLRVQLVNAGHLPPFVVRDGSAHQIDLDPAVPFGLGHFKPHTRELSLQPGDALYAFSDGIIEAQGSQRQPFGGDALVDFIAQHERDGIPVQRVCRNLLSKIVEHVGGALRDDATILGMRISPSA